VAKGCPAGGQYIYYVGVGLGDCTPEEKAEAETALQSYADGHVELAQRRKKKDYSVGWQDSDLEHRHDMVMF
jgi:hypothetical protein